MKCRSISPDPLSIDRLVLSSLAERRSHTAESIAASWGVDLALVKLCLVTLTKRDVISIDHMRRALIVDVREILAYSRSVKD